MGAEIFSALGSGLVNVAENEIKIDNERKQIERGTEALKKANDFLLEQERKTEEKLQTWDVNESLQDDVSKTYDSDEQAFLSTIEDDRIRRTTQTILDRRKGTLLNSLQDKELQYKKVKTKNNADTIFSDQVGRVFENPDKETIDTELENLNSIYAGLDPSIRQATIQDRANDLYTTLADSRISRLSQAYADSEITGEELLEKEKEIQQLILSDNRISGQVKANLAKQISNKITKTASALKATNQKALESKLNANLELVAQGNAELDPVLVERYEKTLTTDEDRIQFKAQVETANLMSSVFSELKEGDTEALDDIELELQTKISQDQANNDYEALVTHSKQLQTFQQAKTKATALLKSDPRGFFQADQELNYLKQIGDKEAEFSLLYDKSIRAGLDETELSPVSSQELNNYKALLVSATPENLASLEQELNQWDFRSDKLSSSIGTPKQLIIQKLMQDKQIPLTGKELLMYGTDSTPEALELRNIALAEKGSTDGLRDIVTGTGNSDINKLRDGLGKRADIASQNLYAQTLTMAIDLASKMENLPQYAPLSKEERVQKAVDLTIKQVYDLDAKDYEGNKMIVPKTVKEKGNFIDLVTNPSNRESAVNYTIEKAKDVDIDTILEQKNFFNSNFMDDLQREYENQGGTVGAFKPEQQAVNLVSDSANFIKEQEGFIREAKVDIDRFTNGYGTEATFEGEVITQAEAQRRLDSKVSEIKQQIDLLNDQRVKKGNTALTKNQYTALTSLVFNVGSLGENLTNAIISGRDDKAVDFMKLYNKAKAPDGRFTELTGLTARREREAELYLSQSEPVNTENLPSGMLEKPSMDFLSVSKQDREAGLTALRFKGKYYVTPTSFDGTKLSNVEIKDQYLVNNKHLGAFDTKESASKALDIIASNLKGTQEDYEAKQDLMRRTLLKFLENKSVFRLVGAGEKARLYVKDSGGLYQPLPIGKGEKGEVRYLEVDVNEVDKMSLQRFLGANTNG